jgi:energy-converting hydrogenase A subunit R
MQFNTDLEGPITLNDNAFEICAQYLEDGGRFFKLVSKYDDVLADIIKRENYKAGNTLKLILPFLKAFGLTNREMEDFSRKNLQFIKGAKDTLSKIKAEMPTFIISTSYGPYVRAVCEALDFPPECAYFTAVDLDAIKISETEKSKLKGLYQKIISMPSIEVSPDASVSVEDLSKQDQQTIKVLDEIFEEISNMEFGHLFQVNPIGGKEKVKAIFDSLKKTGNDFSELIYVGDSITDMEALKVVRAKGGLAVSFNGNSYALREAELACISETAHPLYSIAKAFRRGKEEVLCLETLKGAKITTKIDEDLIKESEDMRKVVRGERVGKLG